MVVGRTAAFAKRRQSLAPSYGCHIKTTNQSLGKRTSDNEEIDKKISLKKSNKRRRSVLSKQKLSTISRHDTPTNSSSLKNTRKHSKSTFNDTKSSFDFATTVIQAARRASEAYPQKRPLNSIEENCLQKDNQHLQNNFYKTNKLDSKFFSEKNRNKSTDSLKSISSSLNSDTVTYVPPWRRR
uniref:Uncharacterized protein n=1 Tax=Strongyloides stercoralis TaxID=6248 RepID=A0A0K0EHG7_STRER